MTGRLKVYDVDSAAWRYVDSVVPLVGTPIITAFVATDQSTASTTYVDVGTGWNPTIVAPASGNVLLLGALEVTNPNTAAIADVTLAYQVDSGADVTCGGHGFNSATDGAVRAQCSIYGLITGLTPGQTYEVSLRWKVTSGTVTYNGSTRGGAQAASRMILVPLP